MLPLVPEFENEHVFAITLWTEKREAEKYDKEVTPNVEQILKPFLTNPVTSMYKVETSVCKHLVVALVEAA